MNETLPGDLIAVDARLRRTSRSFAYPQTPGIAAAVRPRLREPRQRNIGIPVVAWPGMWARAAGAVAAAAVVIIAAALVVPTSRGALADFFGLSHVRVTTNPTPGPTPRPLSPQSFARPVTLDAVRATVDFPVRLPTRDGELLQPDAVYLQGEAENAPVVILVYEAEGYDLYESSEGLFGKGADDNLIHQITFGGHNALWIDVGNHVAEFLDAQGRVVVESRRTVGRATLLWEEDGVTYRLETSLTQTEAIVVAESLQ